MLKLAFPTTEGETISAHLGSAPYFAVVTLHEDGHTTRELRPKPAHAHDQHEAHDPSAHAPGGHAAAMFAVIADCQVLIARGMGEPAYQRARAQGLEVYLVAEHTIEEALTAYRAGTLRSDPRRVHRH